MSSNPNTNTNAAVNTAANTTAATNTAYESAVLNASAARVWRAVRRMDFVWDPTRVLGVKVVGADDREVLSWKVGDSATVFLLAPNAATIAPDSSYRIRFTALSDDSHSANGANAGAAGGAVSWDRIDDAHPTPSAAPALESHTIRVRPITATNTTFIEWTTTFAAKTDATAMAGAITASAKEKREQFALLAADLARPFTYHSTADDVAGANPRAVKGRTFVVTGANTGIGFETARVLAVHGGHVIITARDTKKAHDAAAEIKRSHPTATVEGCACALDSFKSIRAFAKEYIARGYALHGLILNAGVMATPYGKTEDGFETQFGVNHVGHFLLTSLLTPVLTKSGTADAPARVVSLTSIGHVIAGVHFEDVNWTKAETYHPWLSYASSKTANILFAKQLNARFKAAGAAVTANAVHPGGIITTLVKHADAAVAAAAAEAAAKDSKDLKESTTATPARVPVPAHLKTVGEGAATTLVAALCEPFGKEGGFYFADCNPTACKPHASDMKAAEQLWHITEKLIAERDSKP